MNRRRCDNRLRIIVLGFLIRLPQGGIAWHYLNYVHGLAELGHDVYYIEDSYDRPACCGPDGDGPTTDAGYGLRFAADAFRRLGLADRWAYYDAHTNRWQGPRAGDAVTLCRTADLVVHVSGLNPIRDWLAGVPVRALIDTDPGFTQIRNLTLPEYRRRAEEHNVFFSFAENIGSPECTIPRDGYPWLATRQPVSLAAWPSQPAPPGGRYTTVMTWNSLGATFEWGGLRLGMKSDSFPPLIALPSATGPIFELAIRSHNAAPILALKDRGWRIADIDAVSRDPWTYQSFIQDSRGEFGVAKAGYVATRCGWFSERSAGYLASGRPVLHQDTGFEEWLPCGAGVLSFASAEEAAEAIACVEADYEAHCRAARELAAEYFAAPRVLVPLIEAAMAGAPRP
jgi:hypothetical protein